MKVHRILLTLVLAAVSFSLIVGQLDGVAVSAVPDAATQPTPVATTSPLPRPAATPDAPMPSLQYRKATSEPPAERSKPRPALVAHIPSDLPITAHPGRGEVIGTMPAGSKYFGEPLQTPILDTRSNDRFGKVTLPFSGQRGTGWIRIAGMELGRNPYSVRADLSRHVVRVMRLDKEIMRFPAATGSPSSPTPVGRYFVTDRVEIAPGGSFGSYAFGLSGIQTRLPAGWTGGDQLAIHGTNDPSSIGTSASAGCLRVSERALDRLQPLLTLGTPVIVEP